MENQTDNSFPHGIEVCVGPFIINNSGQVLLNKSPKWNNWVICGGHVEPGEHLTDALMRETREELGIDIQVLDCLRFFDEIIAPPVFKRKAHFLFFDYVATPLHYNFKLNDEITEMRWFDLSEALQLTDIRPALHDGLLILQNWLNNHPQIINHAQTKTD